MKRPQLVQKVICFGFGRFGSVMLFWSVGFLGFLHVHRIEEADMASSVEGK